MKLILLSLFLASNVFAKEASITKWGGLDDSQDSMIIADHRSQDCLNVEASRDGLSIEQREGYYLTDQLTYSTSAVINQHSFNNSSGDELRIVAHDVLVQKSVNGAPFASFFSTATANAVWDFVDANGYLYMVNDKRDGVWRFDNATLYNMTDAPVFRQIETMTERMVGTGVAGFLNRVYFSKANDFDTWTIGTETTDPWYEDFGTSGEEVTYIGAVMGRLLVAKRDSITMCFIDNQFNSECSKVADTFGIKARDAKSVVYRLGYLYFKANDDKIYKTDGAIFEEISKPVSTFLSNLLTGEESHNIQTSQVDWVAGTISSNGPTPALSATIDVGSVVPSTWTRTDTSSADFIKGTLVGLTTSYIDGQVRLDYSTSSVLFENFTSGFATWTKAGGNDYWLDDDDSLAYGSTSGDDVYSDSIYKATATLAIGEWKGVMKVTAPNIIPSYAEASHYFIASDSNPATTEGYFIVLTATRTVYTADVKFMRTGGYLLGTYQISQVGEQTVEVDWKIQRNMDGLFTWFVNDVQISTYSDTTHNEANYQILHSSIALAIGNSSRLWFDSIYIPPESYPFTGTFTSQPFDTMFSTPIGGPFDATISTPTTETTLDFYVRESTGVWTEQEVYTSSSTDLYLRKTSGWSMYSQGFTHTSDYNISKVALNLSKGASPTGNIQVEIWDDSSGLPSSIVGTRSIPVDISTLSGSTDFLFPKVVHISSGVQYHIVLNADNTIDGTNYIEVEGMQPGSYANGRVAIADENGTWSFSGTSDIRFFTYSMSEDNAYWSAWTATTDTVHVTMTERYQQYQSTFSTTNSTMTPVLYDVTLVSASTGTIESQCIQPGTSIDLWGKFTAVQTTTGGGAGTFWSRSATDCTSISTHTWTSQTNNAVVSVSTNSAYDFKWLATITASTDTAELESVTTNWSTDDTPAYSYGVYFDDAIYWCLDYESGTLNNRMLKYDLILNEWFPFNIACNAPLVIDNVLFFGDTNEGKIYRYGGVNADNNVNIASHWQSKDFVMGDPFVTKNINKISFFGKGQTSEAGSLTWYLYTNRNYTRGSIDLDLSTLGDILVYNYNAEAHLREINTVNFKLTTSTAYSGWEIFAIYWDYTLKPWRVQP